MIDRSELKKGDRVLAVGPGERHDNVAVVSVGKKYIGVQLAGNEGPFGPVDKFINDVNMEQADWSARRLFLGTLEELKRAEAERDAAMEVWDYICRKRSQSTPLWKLSAMKAVMDSPTLEEAECKIHELVVYGQSRT